MPSILHKLVDNKIDSIKLEILYKANREYMSVTYGCIRFIDSYWFLSSSFISLVTTVFDNIQKLSTKKEKEIVGDDYILKNVNGIESVRKKLLELWKNFPGEIEKRA